ncbi:hypothetical protein D3C86_1596290 [compost metagenome]
MEGPEERRTLLGAYHPHRGSRSDAAPGLRQGGSRPHRGPPARGHRAGAGRPGQAGPHEGRLPLGHQPRAAHPAQLHHGLRLHPRRRGRRPPDHPAARVPGQDPLRRRAPALPREQPGRDEPPLGRPAPDPARPHRVRRPDRARPRDLPAARRRQADPAGVGHPGPWRDPDRWPAPHPGHQQPGGQRHQVHPGRRPRHDQGLP